MTNRKRNISSVMLGNVLFDQNVSNWFVQRWIELEVIAVWLLTTLLWAAVSIVREGNRLSVMVASISKGSFPFNSGGILRPGLSSCFLEKFILTRINALICSQDSRWGPGILRPGFLSENLGLERSQKTMKLDYVLTLFGSFEPLFDSKTARNT